MARIRAAIAGAGSPARSVVLVSGEAGIGKTALVRAATRDSPLVAWGTCIDDAGAPGYWPWTRSLDALTRRIGIADARTAAGRDAALLATIAPAFGDPPRQQGGSSRDRVLLMEAVSRWLDRIASSDTVVLVLDDLQWADGSSMALLDFVARSPEPARLCLIAAYRHDELPHEVRHRLARLAASTDHVELRGLDRKAVASLVEAVTGSTAPATIDECYRRAGGHPVFTRELALLSASPTGSTEVPRAVQDVIEARVQRLPTRTRRVLEIAALAGNDVHLAVLAGALGEPPADVEGALSPALQAGMVLADGEEGLRFAHDLYRETIVAGVPAAERPFLHRALGTALEQRAERSGDASPADLARHFTACVAVDGAARAARWALAAAACDRRSLAFTEAAAHLRRWRAAVADAGVAIEDTALVDVLLVEADALARGGSVVDARGLLRLARDLATRAGAADRLARVALAVTELGAQFATRRDEVVQELDGALAAVAGSDPVLEARLTAALARELQHSVASDRPRAGPLSERALELGRRAGDAETLMACLLARHDVLWTPGASKPRVDVAEEIVAVAERIGDEERRAEGLLLVANGLLELGSAAFLPALESSLAALERLGQPRHEYIAETRRAALALLHGELDDAAERIEAAARLGLRIREPDVENVRMSQQLELVRAGGDTQALTAFAAAATSHWVGAPVHAHAVAAGFLARAGDEDGARRHVATVLDLGTWRVDRSYLWSVFVHELSVAAIALDDRALCRELLDELRPLASSCGVNGAVVAFAGSHGHTAAILAEALGLDAGAWRQAAAETYARLGARSWLADLATPTTKAEHSSRSLRRRGRWWDVVFHDERATVPHTKGIADLANLLARPDKDVHVLELYGSDDRSRPTGTLADRQALGSYRRRLRDLDEELEESVAHHDVERQARLAVEREALVEELRSVTGRRGGGRPFANYPAERARKAVAARLRDAIRRLATDAPTLAAHLDGAVSTGMQCRYRSDGGPTWEVTEELQVKE